MDCLNKCRITNTRIFFNLKITHANQNEQLWIYYNIHTSGTEIAGIRAYGKSMEIPLNLKRINGTLAVLTQWISETSVWLSSIECRTMKKSSCNAYMSISKTISLSKQRKTARNWTWDITHFQSCKIRTNTQCINVRFRSMHLKQ